MNNSIFHGRHAGPDNPSSTQGCDNPLMHRVTTTLSTTRETALTAGDLRTPRETHPTDQTD